MHLSPTSHATPPLGTAGRGFAVGLSPIPLPISIVTFFTFFKELVLGPLSLRAGGGDNWSQFDIGFSTNRNAGMAARETAIRFGFKSDHLLALTGTDNANDTYLSPEGDTVYGKVSITPGGAVHVLTAQQVYAAQVHERARKAGLQSAADTAAELASAVA